MTKTMYPTKKNSEDGKSDNARENSIDMVRKTSQMSKMSNTSRGGFNFPLLQEQERQEANKRKAHYIL